MNLQDHLRLYNRHILPIATITIIATLATAIFGTQMLEQKYKTTMFLSFSVQSSVIKTTGSTTYDDVQAADHFTETIQGWFKNPKFLEKIEEKGGSKTNISAKKQEKQNLVITYSSDTDSTAGKTAKSIKETLSKEISRYNNTTETDFQIALSSTDTKAQSSRLPIFIILGFILGILFGIGLSYIYEYLFGFASFQHQVESILEKKAD